MDYNTKLERLSNFWQANIKEGLQNFIKYPLIINDLNKFDFDSAMIQLWIETFLINIKLLSKEDYLKLVKDIIFKIPWFNINSNQYKLLDLFFNFFIKCYDYDASFITFDVVALCFDKLVIEGIDKKINNFNKTILGIKFGSITEINDYLYHILLPYFNLLDSDYKLGNVLITKQSDLDFIIYLLNLNDELNQVNNYHNDYEIYVGYREKVDCVTKLIIVKHKDDINFEYIKRISYKDLIDSLSYKLFYNRLEDDVIVENNKYLNVIFKILTISFNNKLFKQKFITYADKIVTPKKFESALLLYYNNLLIICNNYDFLENIVIDILLDFIIYLDSLIINEDNDKLIKNNIKYNNNKKVIYLINNIIILIIIYISRKIDNNILDIATINLFKNSTFFKEFKLNINQNSKIIEKDNNIFLNFITEKIFSKLLKLENPNLVQYLIPCLMTINIRNYNWVYLIRYISQ